MNSRKRIFAPSAGSVAGVSISFLLFNTKVSLGRYLTKAVPTVEVNGFKNEVLFPTASLI